MFLDAMLRVYSYSSGTVTLVASAPTNALPQTLLWNPSCTAYIYTASSINNGTRRMFLFDPLGSTSYYG